MPNPNNDSNFPNRGEFLTTRWSLVSHAGKRFSDSHEAALAELCQAYWYPLYVFARRQGKSHEDAQDATQGFLARLMERNSFGTADREKGRFRTYLLAGFKHFMADEWRKGQALKRGGQVQTVPLGQGDGLEKFLEEPNLTLQPEVLFDRSWALAVIDRVETRLEAEYNSAGKGDVFRALRPSLLSKGEESHAEISQRTGLTEGGVRMGIHRMRRKFGDLIRDEVGHTVASVSDVEDEVRWLMRVLAENQLEGGES